MDVIFDDERENDLLPLGACYVSVDSMFPVTFPRGFHLGHDPRHV